MADNPIYIRANRLLGLYHIGLNDIVALNQQLPKMQETAAGLEWIVNSMAHSPSAINVVTDEKLIDYLDKAQTDAPTFGALHQAAITLGPIAYTTAGSVPYEYSRYLKTIKYQFHDQPQVVAWAIETLADGAKLEAIKRRSDIAQKRLGQLHPELAQLHEKAVEDALQAKSNPQFVVSAAAVMDRLLERFKGELYAKCSGDTNPAYYRISECLAVNSELTKEVVKEGQNTYYRLNQELVPVRKSDKSSTGERMVELLRELEEHVVEITSALDPDNVGVAFSS